MHKTLHSKRAQVATALLLTCALLGTGCHDDGSSKRDKRKTYAPVQALLMPAGTKEARITLQRVKTRTGKVRRMLPRALVASRSATGVVYRFRERTDPMTWRLSAQLFIDARPDGAWLRAQYGLGGKRVGVRGARLLFPWPPKPGTQHKVSYGILDGRKATGTVTVLRYGFARVVDGKEYKPCLEVREVLKFKRGGGLDLRTVFCKGFGRVELETLRDSLGKGKTRLVDKALKLED